jgi:parallel beta-helix repeat protein
MKAANLRALVKKTFKRTINLSVASILAVTSLSGAAPLLFSGSALAAGDTSTVCATICDFPDIASAVAAVPADSIIDVQQDYLLSSTITVNKTLTFITTANAIVNTTSLANGFIVTASGVTFDGLNFITGTNGSSTAAIGVQAANTTIKNNVFTGQYNHGDSPVSRALVVSPSVLNLVVSGNQFHHLRQPAYIDNGVTGSVSNNFVETTKGWVVGSKSNLTFTGNSWGVGLSRNAVDIAIINADTAPTSQNNYSAATLSAANNNAVVDDQITAGTGTHTFTTTFVQASAPAGGDGTWLKPYNSIQTGISNVGVNGTVSVAAGTYNENVVLNKQATVQGAGEATTKIVATDGNATPVTFSSNNATLDGFTITHEYTSTELTAWNFNNNGVAFGQFTTGNTLSNSTVSLSRNGVYFNRSQGNKVIDNTITNNRTGINMTNTVNDTQITGNTISDNWTIGLVMYSATPTLATDLSTVTVSGNTFDQNWYSEILIKDAPLFTGTLNVTNNTFTDAPVTYSTSSSAALNEPGFAALQPVSLGGTAVKPAQELPTLRIYNAGDAAFDYTSSTLDVNADEVVLTNDGATVSFPKDTVITPSTPSAWNGVVSAPTVVTTTLPLPGGATQGVAIEVGSTDASLTFDQAAKLVIAGEAGKLVGYMHSGAFVKITATCSANTQAAGNALPAGGDCYMNVGNDLVVWTKHFTTFATFTPDTTKPTITFTNPTDFNTPFSVGPNLTIKAVDSASGIASTLLHVYKSDNTPVKFCPVANSDTTSCDTSSFGNGDYYVKAAATDNAGNGQTVTKYFTIDNIRPDATITAPANNALLNNGSFTVTGTASDGQTSVSHVNIYITKLKADGSFNGYAVNNQVATYNSATKTFSYNVSGLSDGKYTIKANAYDQAGNSHFATAVTITVDSTAPTGTLSYSPSTLTNHSVIATLETSEPIKQSSLPGTWNKVSDTKYTKSYATNTVQNVTLEDLAGNASTASVNISWIDKTAPTGSIHYGSTQPTNGNVNAYLSTSEAVQTPSGWTATDGTGQNFKKKYTQNKTETVTFTDLAGNSGSANVEVTWIDKTAPTGTLSYDPATLTNNDVTVTLETSESIKQTSLPGTWTKVSNTKYTKVYAANAVETVTLEDLVGNTSTLSVNISWIDKTAPTGSIHYGNTQPINGNVIAYLQVDEVVQTPSGWTATDGTNQNFKKKYTTNKTETVTFTDLAGNTSTANVEVTWIDKTAPVVAITGPQDGDTVHGTVTISGTVTETNPDHYYLVVLDSNNNVVAGPGTVNAATVTDYAWDTTGVAAGTYTISLAARDAAGNRDAGSSKTITVTVDNDGPVVNFSGYGQNGNVIRPNVTATDSNGPVTYSWTTNPNVTISDVNALDPTFTVLQDGTYTFTLTATDASGNATSDDFSFTYTTPPATPTAPAFTAVAVSSNGTGTGNGGTTSTPLTDGSTGVLGISTGKDNQQSDVKGLNTTTNKDKQADNTSAFLGLGWYWLIVLAVVAALGYLFVVRRADRA